MNNDTPNNPASLVESAKACLRKRDYTEAERLVNQALQAAADNCHALNTLAAVLHFTARDEHAIEVLRRAIEDCEARKQAGRFIEEHLHALALDGLPSVIVCFRASKSSRWGFTRLRRIELRSQ